MLAAVRRRATFANVVSVLALFVALGGTSVAAVKGGVLPFSSVGTNQLATNSVTSVKVKNSSIRINDLTPGARAWLRGQAGTAGPAGAAGPVGATGPGSTMVNQTITGTFATSSTSYVGGGGPRVTVNVVPKSSGAATGLVQVWAQMTVGQEAGAVALFDVTGAATLVPGQQTDVCLPGESLLIHGDPTFFPTPVTVSTPAVFGPTGCGSTNPASPVLLELPVGTRQLELRYLQCGCSGTDAEFSNRSLWVAAVQTAS